ncbi:MAG: DUF1501 domain-containing protein [Acidobacteria bacterium]|nr:DUF1501 domain-containing protein [Acidobacteriota bacterium]
MAHSRRDFLKGTLSLLTLSLAAPTFSFESSKAFAAGTSPNKILVVVQLDGGNDGLNTVVPYSDKAYYAARPNLAIPETSVLKASDKVGFHPVMTKFKGLFDQQKIAVIQNVGYPNPNLSHFQSRAILNRADPTTREEVFQLGWLGKYGDLKSNSDNPLSIVNLGDGRGSLALPKSLVGNKILPSSINSFPLYQFLTDAQYPSDRNNQVNTFVKSNSANSTSSDFLYIGQTGLDAVSSSESLQTGIKKYTPAIKYPENSLGVQLQMAAQIIAGDLGAEIIHVTLGGFDTHSGQKDDQEELLTAISESFDAFYQDLVRLGKADKVLVMAFSEFGRRVRENGSAGTDHGTSGPMFVMGNAVKGGLYGNSPDLTNLDSAGNTVFDIDFRAVYGTVLSDWLQTDSQAVLGSKFENIGFINK